MRKTSLAWTRAALLAVALALTAIGVLFVHSSASHGESFPGRAAQSQMLKALVAICVVVVVSRLDYRMFNRFAYLFYGAMLAALVALLAATSSRSVTARWIDLGLIKIQPSELMKVAVIVALARYLHFRESYRKVSGLIIPYLLVFLPMALVAAQPDLGTSLMLPPVLLALLFVARARLWPLLITVLAGVGSLPLAYLLSNRFSLVRDYQLRRIADYLHQEGYHLEQSLISLGSGGLTGKGWGQGTQNTLRWLPEKHTDFIFSVVGEEWGFVGAAAVITLCLMLVVLCLRVAIRTREPFGRLAAAGVGVAFAAQSIQNIGMTMGLTPITGLPLPFVSFGGSSLVSSFLALGVVWSVASRPVRVVASRDLNPLDPPRVLEVSEHRPAGSILRRWPV